VVNYGYYWIDSLLIDGLIGLWFILKVYEGQGRTADECHFLGEFELSGIPPLPKNVPEIQATFKIDTNGILSMKASYGDMVKGMKLDVYSKSGGMIGKTRDKMHLILGQLMGPSSEGQAKCELLEDATPMSVIPVKPRKSNVLKLSVDSEVRNCCRVLLCSHCDGDEGGYGEGCDGGCDHGGDDGGDYDDDDGSGYDGDDDGKVMVMMRMVVMVIILMVVKVVVMECFGDDHGHDDFGGMAIMVVLMVIMVIVMMLNDDDGYLMMLVIIDDYDNCDDVGDSNDNGT
jgi:hypothetical protein